MALAAEVLFHLGALLFRDLLALGLRDPVQALSLPLGLFLAHGLGGTLTILNDHVLSVCWVLRITHSS